MTEIVLNRDDVNAAVKEELSVVVTKRMRAEARKSVRYNTVDHPRIRPAFRLGGQKWSAGGVIMQDAIALKIADDWFTDGDDRAWYASLQRSNVKTDLISGDEDISVVQIANLLRPGSCVDESEQDDMVAK